MLLGTTLVILDKRRSRADPGSNVRLRNSTMDPGPSFARPGWRRWFRRNSTRSVTSRQWRNA